MIGEVPLKAMSNRELTDALITAAGAEGHWGTLRSSDQATVDYWLDRTKLIREEILIRLGPR